MGLLELFLSLDSPEGGGPIDYAAEGVRAPDVEELLVLALDPELLWADMHSPEVWVPVHALRALTQIGDPRSVPPLMALLAPAEEEDWLIHELLEFFQAVGPPALGELGRYLLDPSREELPRAIAAEAVGAIGEGHPSAREEAIGILTASLERFDTQPPFLNSLVMGFLVDLKAVEAAPLMERVFESGRVEVQHLGDWEDVQIELGLISERSFPRAPFPPLLPGLEAALRRREAEARKAEARARAGKKARRKAARKSRKKNRGK